MSTATAISFDKTSVDLDNKSIWSNLTTKIKTGTFTAILGPNGAGKSTLLRAILGSQQLSEGSIEIFGNVPGVFNRDIGYLPQRRSFDEGVRIRGIDIVRLGLDGDQWGIPLPKWSARERQKRTRVKEVIELVGAQNYAHRAIGEMSGGEQQRLLIAQALVRNPRLLLLDEPLDSLDIPNQYAIASLIQNARNLLGITVIMVAHDVNPILRYLDQVLYMANGKALVGLPKDVITTESLSKLYGMEIEVLRASDGRVVVVGGTDVTSYHGHR